MAANPGRQNFALQCAPATAPPRIDQSTTAISRLVQRMLGGLRRTDLFSRAFLQWFRMLQACGISVVPNHFYWPIPDVRTLERRLWTVRTPGFDLNLPGQAQFALQVVPRFIEELQFEFEPAVDGREYHRNNGMFETVDADVAYCMVRHFKPARIVEIGGGYSTRLLARALRVNQARDGGPGELLTIEPHPDKVIRAGIPGLTRLFPQPVQDVPLTVFESLDAGDILFIDSSHVVTVGSDVVYEFLEILPRLRPGVLIHLHDIFYPCDYPRDAVLRLLWFWSEQYLLELLLTWNASFEVIWSSSAMQLLCADVLRQAFPAWDNSYARMPPKIRRFLPTADGSRVWPSSFWMRRCAPVRTVPAA